MAANQADENRYSSIMRPARQVGIVGYGAYIPRYRLPASEVSRGAFSPDLLASLRAGGGA